MSVAAYLALLACAGALRLAELHISARNRRRLVARGVPAVPDPCFPWMVLLHAGVLLGAGLEVVLLRRPFRASLAVSMGMLLAAAMALRFWAMRTLAVHWNVRVMASTRLGVVSGGPYRLVRHPNYVAVFVELVALPLVHGAWLAASLGAALHLVVLRRRIEVEEGALLADREYRSVMGAKPRFVPRWVEVTSMRGAGRWPTS